MFGCLWQPLHHFQTSFKMFSAREIFPNNKNEIFVQDCVDHVSVYLSLCWNTVIKIWATLQNEDGENVIFTIQLRLRGFVRGHKNMSHIRKWRKIVLIIIKFYARKSVGRNVTTHISKFIMAWKLSFRYLNRFNRFFARIREQFCQVIILFL